MFGRMGFWSNVPYETKVLKRQGKSNCEFVGPGRLSPPFSHGVLGSALQDPCTRVLARIMVKMACGIVEIQT
jgi:hypothetical protein